MCDAFSTVALHLLYEFLGELVRNGIPATDDTHCRFKIKKCEWNNV